MTSAATIECLRECFARFGLLTVLVSDNGTNFVSAEFKDFLTQNGIKHITTAPYHPSSNDQAERYVQIIKNGLKKTIHEKGNLHLKLTNLLMHFRRAPHSATNVSPAELMFRRNLRSKLDLMVSHVTKQMEECRSKLYSKDRDRNREFKIGDQVRFRNVTKNQKWLIGIVIEKRGTCTYIHHRM